jgi:hypothetical protein
MCYIEEACAQAPSTKNDNNTGTPGVQQCADGHTGPLCNVCLSGYARDVLGICRSCDASSFHLPTETIIFILVVICVVSAFWYVLCRKKPEKSDRLSVYRERASTRLAPKTQNVLDVAQNDRDHWFYRARTKAKILVSFGQIISNFESVLEGKIWEM